MQKVIIIDLMRNYVFNRFDHEILFIISENVQKRVHNIIYDFDIFKYLLHLKYSNIIIFTKSKSNN